MSRDAILHGEPISLSNKYSTLAEMFLYISSKYPASGMRFIEISGKEDFCSYRELLDIALEQLKVLQTLGFKPGDVAILEVSHAKAFYAVFWACILGNIIPAPVTKPASFEPGSETLIKLFSIWEILGKPIIIVEESYKNYYRTLQDSPLAPDFLFYSTDELNSVEKAEVQSANSEDLAVLQFSSGSTGTPKGVQLTHNNILANIHALALRFGLTEIDNSFMWVPHTHDMGLFMQYLSSVMVGSNLMIFSPHTFVRSPTLFLKKITAHKGTWFTSPNFGFDWMARKVPDEILNTLDLSSLRFTLNAAEPISVSVINNFIKKFSSCGYTPEKMCTCYGLAEATVGVTVSIIGEPANFLTLDRAKVNNEHLALQVSNNDEGNQVHFVKEGPPIAGISVRIADAQGNQLKQNQIGEIQVKGPSVTKGYYHCEEINKKLFEGGWLHTGDLGFITSGALVITGRKKDIIFVRGQNYYSHDLEEILYNAGEIPRGDLAFVGVFNTALEQEELIAFVKYKHSLKNFLPLREHIVTKTLATLGINISHVIPTKSLPKTTSGKLKRYYLRQCYENGDYNHLLEEIKLCVSKHSLIVDNNSRLPDCMTLTSVYRKIWSKLLCLPEEKISIDATFFSLGGNSILAFELMNEIESYLKTSVNIEILVVCKTIRHLVDYTQKHLNNLDTQTINSTESLISGASDMNNSIAITGMALRLPKAENQEAFWDLLCSMKNCFSKVSTKRKTLAGQLEWDAWLAELDNIDSFDNEFFEIPTEEAKFIDPQQRLLLEVAYEALEDAGLIPALAKERNIGVYSGVGVNSYYELVVKFLDRYGIDQLHPNTQIRNLSNMMAASISRTFNFTGPAVAVDTACSSFLSALFHAVVALRQKSIEGAVVAGVNLLVTPTVHELSRRSGILSSGPYPKVFDQSADGTVLGEGVFVYYLEPLKKAITYGRNIYGVIRGIGMNNDGASFGIMAPSPKGQYEVLLHAYRDAGLSPDEVDYIEAHGTGTTIGDPIEVNVLARLFSNQKKNDLNSIGIGSVKTNVGHLLSAAGAAGLAKVLLCLKHKKLVPNLHLKTLNPTLKLEKSPFYIVNEIQEWEKKDGITRKAGLSSFGFGGTNVHIVVEEWLNKNKNQGKRDKHILTFSAKSQRALNLIVDQTLTILNGSSDINIEDICFTRNCFRKHYSYRSAFLIEGDTKKITAHFEGNFLNKVQPIVHVIIGDYNVLLNNPSNVSSWHLMFKNLKKIMKSALYFHGIGAGVKIIDSMSGHASDQSVQKNPDIIISFGVDHPQIKKVFSAKSLKTAKIINFNDAQIDFDLKEELPLIAQLYVAGVDFDWQNIYSPQNSKLVYLPPYPFKKKSFWIETS